MGQEVAKTVSKREGWIGPLFRWELLRLGRRGTAVAARVFTALLLLAVLWVVYQSEMSVEYLPPQTWPLDLNEPERNPQAKIFARFAETFAVVFLLAQLGVICLLTPIFTAGAIFEERDRKTMEFLLATDLTGREIILGKYLSRVVQLIGVLLAGLPILAITQVWGGVDLLLIAIGDLYAITWIFAIGAVGIAFGVFASTLRSAVAGTYVIVILLTGLPVVALSELPARLPQLYAGNGAIWAEALAPVFVGAAVAFITILVATLHIRSDRFLDIRKPPARRTSVSLPASTGEPKRHWSDPPHIADRPFWWKERWFSGGTNRFLRLLGLVPPWVWVGVVTAGTMIALAYSDSGNIHRLANRMTRHGGLFLVAIMVMAIGLSAAGSIAKERQQQTITDLLMVPHPRRTLLRAKFFASLYRGFGPACGVGAIIIFGLLSEGIAWEAAPFLILAAAVFAAFAASLGIWLSVRCQSVMRASNLWMLLMLLLLGGTYLAAESLSPELPDQFSRSYRPRGWDPDLRDVSIPWDRVLHPVYAWQQLAFRWDSADDSDFPWLRREERWGWLREGDSDQIWPALGGLALFGLSAWILWMFAVRRFQKEGQA